MLLDTSGLFCFLNSREAAHAAAVAYMGGAPRRVTHNLVLAELVALWAARRLPRGIVLSFVHALVADASVEVIWAGKAEHEKAMSLLDGRPDKAYSLCDATSFVVMRREGLTDALTTDHHFQQEGFGRLLQP